MKTAKRQKNRASHPHLSKPFFSKSGERSFFSKIDTSQQGRATSLLVQQKQVPIDQIQPYREKEGFNFGRGTAVGTYVEETFNDPKTQPWISKIEIVFKTKTVDAKGNEYWKGDLTANYHPNGNEPTAPLGAPFTIPISGGGKDQGWTDKGDKFVVRRIEGVGYNSGKYSEPFGPGERESGNWKYSKPKPDGTIDANMHYAVFYNGGEAIHAGGLDVSSHGCVHVDNMEAMKLINYHSVIGRTKVSVKYPS